MPKYNVVREISYLVTVYADSEEQAQLIALNTDLSNCVVDEIYEHSPYIEEVKE